LAGDLDKNENKDQIFRTAKHMAKEWARQNKHVKTVSMLLNFRCNDGMV